MAAAATGPDWLGSPQHFLAGLVLGAFVVFVLSRLISAPKVVVAILAIGIVCLAEVAVELIEYPLLYSDSPHVSAYYDTLADLAATLAGGAVGAVAAALSVRKRVDP